MFFISRGLCVKSFQDVGIVCSPGIAECTLTDLIWIWGRGGEDDIKALDLMKLGLWATYIYVNITNITNNITFWFYFDISGYI